MGIWSPFVFPSFQLSNIPLRVKRRRLKSRAREERPESTAQNPKHFGSVLSNHIFYCPCSTFSWTDSNSASLIGKLLHSLIQSCKVLLNSHQIFLHCLLDLVDKKKQTRRATWIRSDWECRYVQVKQDRKDFKVDLRGDACIDVRKIVWQWAERTGYKLPGYNTDVQLPKVLRTTQNISFHKVCC